MDVTVADGSTVTVHGTVTVAPISTLPDDHVLNSPVYPFHFGSVSAITKAFHCSLTFSPESYVF